MNDTQQAHPLSPTGQQRSDFRGPLGVTGLIKARDIVKDILEQVSLNDCPPINSTLMNNFQGNNGVQSKGKKEKRQLSASSSISEGNTSISGTITHSQGSSHGSGLPRPISRQRHVLPTLLSPSASSAMSGAPKNDTTMENHNRLSNQSFDSGDQPSPTSAEAGDGHFFDNNLSSPSFANSHLRAASSETIEYDKLAFSSHLNTPPTQVEVLNDIDFGSQKLPPPPSINKTTPRNNSYTGTGAEIVMGHLSLAALCTRTLESISKDFDMKLPNQMIVAREQDTKFLKSESREDLSSWQREVEMAPTFATTKQSERFSDEKKMELSMNEQNQIPNAAYKRKKFLSSIDDDDYGLLFPDANDALDDSDILNDDSLKVSLDEDESTNNISEKTKNKQTSIPTKSNMEDGFYLSSVEEGDEDGEESPRGYKIGELNSFSPETKLTVSPDQAIPRPRMQMFGSEYARHLSSQSPFSPSIPRVKQPKSRKPRKSSKSSSAAITYCDGTVGPATNSGISVASSNVRGGNTQEAFPRSGSYSVSTMSSASHGSNSSNSIALEDASDEILSAAITDIVVTHGKEMPPKGYFRISHTSNGTQVDSLKKISTGNNVLGRRNYSSVHINVKKEPKWEKAVQRPCVTALTVIFPDRNEFVPPGFCVVRKYQGNFNLIPHEKERDKKSKEGESLSLSEPANLNFGTTGERVYLCYRRSREGNPITGLIPLQPSSNEAIPEGYTVIERSPRNFVADINSKAGAPVFLAFRQRLANLETLRPLPLVLSVHCAQALPRSPAPKGKSKKSNRFSLQSYYCTGGTVVPAQVGRYHVMDRSTHPLISPSSVSNRLTLIHASRSKRTAGSVDGSGSVATETPSIGHGISTERDTNSFGGVPSSDHYVHICHNDNGSLSSDAPSAKGSMLNGIISLVNSISPTNKSSVINNEENSAYGDCDESSYSAASSVRSSIFVSRSDSNLQSCFDAMDFIPRIDAPGRALLSDSEEQNMNTLLQTRIALITPILTACYTQHGGSALLVVEGLSTLLNETDFFLQDIAANEDPQCSDNLTLLDLSVQVVCDMATCTARETHFLPCIEFVSQAFYYSGCNLSTRTIGYAIRFYLFTFFFGASVPTTSCWPRNLSAGVSKKNSLDEANDVMLLSEDELRGYRRGYVPGGAPQAGALALKELITLFFGKCRKMKSIIKNCISTSTFVPTVGIEGMMSAYVNSVIDGAVRKVDVANFTQLALHQIHRSGGSELFWYDMLTSCGSGLFSHDRTCTKAVKDFFITSFSILASLVKVASGKIRKLSNSAEPVPRDVASKLLSMELIHHFLVQWGNSVKYLESRISKAQQNIKPSNKKSIEDIESISTIAYNIRRLVVPCLLANTRPGLEDIKVFRRMMKIVTVLWCNEHIRRHMKIEIGVLIEHFVLKILRLGPQVLSPKRLSSTTSSLLNDLPVALLPQQVCVVNEIKTWFQFEPRDVLELFMNFDQVDAQSKKKKFHLLPSTHWKITQQLCGALCTLAEQCTDIISEQIRLTRIDLSGVETQSPSMNNSIQFHSGEDLREMSLVRDGARYLQEKCFDAIGQITRSIMLCAAASSGANGDLLVKLREKKRKDDLMKSQISIGKENNACAQDDNQSESSIESDGNMTIKSVSTIGNIVGGILNKKKDGNAVETLDKPDSPRTSNKLIPPSAIDSDDDIVEYWQTSIAAERRKNSVSSVSGNETNQSMAKKLPPRAKRLGLRTPPVVGTPPRLTKVTSFSPSSKSPKLPDDVSILSMADDSLRGDPQFTQKMEDTLNVAFEIMQNKSLKKAFDYLIACNFLTSSPKDIASFLRLYQSRIDTATLGEFLGEGGKDGDEKEHFNLIRFHYVSAISFVGMNVEQGLRYFLTNCGFRLPGEAQKIDRIMTTFSQCYWEDNAGDHGKCPFHDEDTVFLISFAIIMLNTDLHKTSMFAAPPGQNTPKQKQRKKMTKSEFLNNLRGVDNSEDLSKEYLSAIYDSIAANPIAIYRSNDNPSFQEGANGSKTIKFSTNEYGHMIQGNTDLAGMLKHFFKNVKICEELLRGLSSHEHPYLSLRNRTDAKKSRSHMVPEELVRSAFRSSWHHFHGTINSALDSAHLDPKGLENCLDVLMYSLCATICLDLSVERNAFASQLVRVKYFRENRGIEEEQAPKPIIKKKGPITRVQNHLDFKHDSWFLRIEKAAESYHENAKIAALDEVDTMFKKLHASLQVDSTLKKEMMKVARKILNGQILLNDPTRYFVRDGELAKKCNRTGRNVKYTFFLFSDVLVYAQKNGGIFKIHGELPLHLMKIMDLSNGMSIKNNSKQTRALHLIHPRKSFVVYAKSTEEKLMWLESINTAIGREVKRKARIEGARQACATFDR